MGGLVGGLFDLFSGDPAKTQENQLSALGGYETGVGEGDVTAASKFYQDILSGDPTRIAQALAPEISAGQQQVSQQAKTNAEFGTRSGGTAAASRAAADNERGNIINLVGGLQSGAASGAGSLGSSEHSQASGNINDVAGMKTRRRQQVVGDVGDIASSVASIASPFLGGSGTSDPYETLYNAQHAPDPELQSQDVTDLIQ